MRESEASEAGVSRRGRAPALFLLLTAALVLATLEAGSWILLFLVEDPGPEVVAGERPPEEADEFRRAAEDRLTGYQALHPFQGFVLDPEHHPEARKGTNDPEAVDFGFAFSRSRVFHEPSAEKLVVAVFGGSVASILSFNGARALEEGLARIPRFASREIHIVSLAMGGFKQPQQLQTLAYLLSLGAHFDLVLNVDGFNEVALPPVENVPAGVYPFFPRQWHQRVANLDPKLRQAIGRLAYLRELRRERAGALAASPWRASGTARLLWTLGDRRLRGRVARAELALADARPDGDLDYQARGPGLEIEGEEELYRALARHWQRSSRQMHRLSRAIGAEYYHVLQPNQYLPGSKPLSAEERREAFHERHRYRRGVELGYPLLAARGAELAAEGIAFFDASGVFRGVSETLYLDPCCHFNRRGNEILAAEIVRRIAAGAP